MGEAAACARYGHIVGGKRCLWVRLYGEAGSGVLARTQEYTHRAYRIGWASDRKTGDRGCEAYVPLEPVDTGEYYERFSGGPLHNREHVRVGRHGEVGSPARGDNFESYADRVGEAPAISVHCDVAGGSFAPSKDCESCSRRRVRGDNYIGWADFPGGAVRAWAEW